MKEELMPYFKKYEALVSKAEAVFEQVKSKFPDEVKCKEGCSDCCHALFDLTLVEALYINFRFNEQFEGKEKNTCNGINSRRYSITSCLFTFVLVVFWDFTSYLKPKKKLIKRLNFSKIFVKNMNI